MEGDNAAIQVIGFDTIPQASIDITVTLVGTADLKDDDNNALLTVDPPKITVGQASGWKNLQNITFTVTSKLGDYCKQVKTQLHKRNANIKTLVFN